MPTTCCSNSWTLNKQNESVVEKTVEQIINVFLINLVLIFTIVKWNSF